MALAAPAGNTAPGAARSYFCSTKGATLRYERYDPEGETHWWTQISRINAVRTRQDGVREVDFTTTIIPDKEKTMVKGDVNSTALLYPDGAVEVNVSDAAAYVARQLFSSLNFTVKGGTSTLKATLKPGDILEDIHGTVDWKGIKLTIDFTDRKVLRRETVTVPAGTFDCIVVREHKLEKAPLHKRDRITYTWYTLDYGMIRHDTHFPDGRQECSEQLYTITK